MIMNSEWDFSVLSPYQLRGSDSANCGSKPRSLAKKTIFTNKLTSLQEIGGFFTL